MKLKIILTSACMLGSLFLSMLLAQTMTNVYGRNYQSLNGKWNVLVDQYAQGRGNAIYQNKKPTGKADFYEYAFENGLRLNVPSDWNSQVAELKYYEGTVWYARKFDAVRTPGKRLFLYFAAVSYRCRIYLNGQEIGQHEGSFTPFQIEVSDLLKDQDNFLAVEVDNRRMPDAIPAMAFDWWNYGGITRDVLLVETDAIYIDDYFIRLDKTSPTKIDATIQLSEQIADAAVQIEIPELKIKQTLRTDKNGAINSSFLVKKLQRWSPKSPKRYSVHIAYAGQHLQEEIGFRNIEVKGEDIYLNGEPIFLKATSFHEEIAQRQGRAHSEADAVLLLSEAKALGCNMIRLAHYPQNEYTVRLAEKMGFLLWEEIPIWQGIDFNNPKTKDKALKMLQEMIRRDKNRCAIGFWGVANETQPSDARNSFLRELIAQCKAVDTSRLITAAFDLVRFNADRQTFVMDDPFTKELDVVAINKYMGWYHQWPVAPDKAIWDVARGQPLIVSEFGGEAIYGKTGDADTASSWSEDYQAQLYRDNIEMFKHIPNLRGTAPWILFDFRSPFRLHPTYQEGWNRKGLVSDQGYRKKAWYIMKNYYQEKN